VGLVALLVAPSGGFVLLAVNYWQLGQRRWAWGTIGLGVLILPVLVGIGAALSDASPGFFLLFLILGAGVLWGAAEVLQRHAYTEHRRKGGRTASVLATVGFALLGLVLYLGTFQAYDAYVRSTPPKIVYGGGEVVYYRQGATEIDARALGAFFSTSGFFNGREPKAVMVSREGSRLVISFVVEAELLNDPKAQRTLRDVGHEAGQRAFGLQSVDIRLCDRQFNVQKKL
jgi:hypothetical protein